MSTEIEDFSPAFAPVHLADLPPEDPMWDWITPPEMAPRSGGWRHVSDLFLTENPHCEVCRTKIQVVVHHVKPFHLFPELELDPTNFITFCPPHHLLVGHLMNWKAYNPHCRNLATQLRAMISKRKQA